MPDQNIVWAVLIGRRVQHATWDDTHIGCDRRGVAPIEMVQDGPWDIDDYRVCRRPYCQRMYNAHQARLPDELADRRRRLLAMEMDLQD